MDNEILDLSSMLVEDITELEDTVKLIVLDMEKNDIYCFGDWLILYDETIEEIENFVNEYCEKIRTNKINEIEHWLKVVMLNSIALYMIEMDLKEVPTGDGMINKLLAVYIETIRFYN